MAHERKVSENAARAIAETMRLYSDRVAWINFYLGETHDGDPGVFFLIVLKNEPPYSYDSLKPVMASLNDLVDCYEWGFLPYNNFRTEAEVLKVKGNEEFVWANRWARPASVVGAPLSTADQAAPVRSRSEAVTPLAIYGTQTEVVVTDLTGLELARLTPEQAHKFGKLLIDLAWIVKVEDARSANIDSRPVRAAEKSANI